MHLPRPCCAVGTGWGGAGGSGFCSETEVGGEKDFIFSWEGLLCEGPAVVCFSSLWRMGPRAVRFGCLGSSEADG